MLEFALILIAAVPIAWFASEFQDRRWLRILLGCMALATSFGVAWVVGTFQRLNYNAWYGSASQEMIDITTVRLFLEQCQLVRTTTL